MTYNTVMSGPRANTTVRTVAVTGAGGFLGSRIVDRLSAAGFDVLALARVAPATPRGGVEAIAWDGRLPPPTELRADAVVDCAAALPSRVGDPDELTATNLALARGAITLAGRSAGLLVFMSSQSAIGRPQAARIDDATPAEPDTPYGRSKLAAERLVAEAAGRGDLAGAAALRLPAVVGAGCHDNFPASVLAQLRAGETVRVFNPDGPYNAVVHADTVAAFVAHLLRCRPAGFRSLCLASRPPIAVRAAVQAVAHGLGVACRLDERPAPHASPVIDPSGAETLGFVADDTAGALERFGRESALHIATPPSAR